MGTSNPLTPILESLFWTYTHTSCVCMYIYIYTPYMQIPGGLSQRHLLFRCTVYELLHARTFKHDDSTCDPLQVRSSFLCIFCGELRAQYQRSESVQPGAISPYVLLSMESHSRTIFLPQWHVSGFGQYNVFLDHIRWLSVCCNFAYPACLDPNGRTSLGGWNTLQPVMLQPISTAISMLI